MEARSNQVKVAAGQVNPQLKMISGNLARCLGGLDEAAKKGANLIVFPELTLSGYIFESREEALTIAETIPGSSTEHLSQKCKSLGVHAVIGLIEKEGSSVYNAAVLFGPNGIIGKYRKTHLPKCGVDLYVDKGDIAYEVHDTSVGKLGIQICYDLQHPEGVRCLALGGAEIIVNIADYPEGVEFMTDFIVQARVIENRVHLVTCGRVGTERGTRFIGGSSIISANSEVLAKADGEEIIYGLLDLNMTASKRAVIRQGENESNLFSDRRPELYGAICQSKSSGPPPA